MPFKHDDIGRLVGKVDGVRLLDNKIEVFPVSQYDDKLRYGIARAIYTNPAFWHYASMVKPPINIIVEHGRVRLTGVVNNKVERAAANSIARSFTAFSVENELKTDAEVEAELQKIV
ncbi:MAG: BON domain-containing protein [Acidobacteria bacterium]|nr:MAG: BON domain-containing protein [Acidobacteriota bacterium]